THRLAMRRASISLPETEKRDAIVSARALTEVERILQADSETPAKVSVSDNQIEFVVGTVTVGSRLIEGQFPDYQKVIPEGCDKRITVNARELEAALRRALIVAREDANRISVTAALDSLKISAESPDVGEVVEEIGAELEGEEVTVSFNARYLLDAINVVTAEQVHIELSGPLNPGVLRPAGDADYIYVLMPMQK
ncbi:MAG TPA: DNA polymerase III subunit beta, partial [Armatimonadota bacterium]|nr:DNA polymerase III subunit beta [Armatimonadota bacterium]